MKLSFGGLTLDTDTRQLRRGQAEIHLSPKAFDLLRLLLDDRPRAISKSELHERLWPDTFVTESNIAGLIAEIRRAMDEDARSPRFVRTVQRFGYAFAGEVSVGEMPERGAERPSGYWLIDGERTVPLQHGENVLGRDPETGEFDSITVSRRHARIVINETGAVLEDLDSKNGTFLRGTRITSAQPLNDGDDIGLGSLVIKFRISRTGRSTRTWQR